jgi:hypothetical protein
MIAFEQTCACHFWCLMLVNVERNYGGSGIPLNDQDESRCDRAAQGFSRSIRRFLVSHQRSEKHTEWEVKNLYRPGECSHD